MPKKKRDHLAKFLMKSTDTVKELIVIYLVVILLASCAFTVFESMPFKDAVWMSFVTATSTGYGDFYAKTFAGRVVAVALMHTVLLVLMPLMVYRFIDAIDNNDFTDSEQEDLKGKMNWLVQQMESQTGQKYAPEQAND